MVSIAFLLPWKKTKTSSSGVGGSSVYVLLSLGNWEGGDGGRADIGAGKKILTLKDPF